MFSKAPEKQGFTEIGASFVVGNATGLVTMLTPAANVNGCMVRTLVTEHNGTVDAVYIDTAAPVDHNDATKRRIYRSNKGLLYTRDLFAPAGNGIYYFASGATGEYSMSYDLL